VESQERTEILIHNALVIGNENGFNSFE